MFELNQAINRLRGPSQSKEGTMVIAPQFFKFNNQYRCERYDSNALAASVLAATTTPILMQ